jgi:tRNA pseudouridine55 synthase
MNGWLLIDKPGGITSTSALNVVKRIFKDNNLKKIKIGHAGTLDPFATGLLLVAIGEATKTINFAMEQAKTYEFTITWGESRDTIDPEGVIIRTSSNVPTLVEIQDVISSFSGTIDQTPPEFSAIKVNGIRAYQLARQGEKIELHPRKVIIYNLTITEHSDNQTSFLIKCGKGFYIRSLARDLASKLNTEGYVSQLRRTKSKNFAVEHAISLDKIKNLLHNESPRSGLQFLHESLKPIDSVLDDILVEEIGEAEAKRLKNGQAILHDAQLQENTKVAVFSNSKLIAVCAFNNKLLKPIRVFNL